MAWTRVGIHRFKAGGLDEAVERARKGLLPIFRKQPGFLSYQLVKTDGDLGISVSGWRTREEAEKAVQLAGKWMDENTKDLVVSRDVHVGEFVLDEGPSTLGEAALKDLYDAFNERDLDRATGHWAPGMKLHVVPFGADLDVRSYMENWIAAFPDAKAKLVRAVAAGNFVFSEFVGTGTHDGTLVTAKGNFAPTHRSVEIRFAEILEVKDGRFVSGRAYFDVASMFEQLGIGEATPRRAATTPEQRPATH